MFCAYRLPVAEYHHGRRLATMRFSILWPGDTSCYSP